MVSSRPHANGSSTRQHSEGGRSDKSHNSKLSLNLDGKSIVLSEKHMPSLKETETELADLTGRSAKSYRVNFGSDEVNASGDSTKPKALPFTARPSRNAKMVLEEREAQRRQLLQHGKEKGNDDADGGGGGGGGGAAAVLTGSDQNGIRGDDVARQTALSQCSIETSFDHKLHRQHLLLLLNAIVAIVCMALELDFTFECHEGAFHPICGEEANADPTKQWHCWQECQLQQTPLTQALKACISILTVLMVLQLFLRSKLLVHIDSCKHDATFSWWGSKHRRQFFKWSLLLWWHVPPFLDHIVANQAFFSDPRPAPPIFNDRINLMIWSRLFFLLPAMHTSSDIFRKRLLIMRGCFKSGYPVPSFSTFLALKSFIHLHGGRFVLWGSALATLVFTQVMHICEREEGGFQSGLTYGGSLWFTTVVLTVLGFGDYLATSPAGRNMTIFCCLVGVTIISFVTAVVVNIVTPAEYQMRAIDESQYEQLKHAEKRAVVKYISLIWKYKVACSRHRRGEMGCIMSPEQFRHLMEEFVVHKLQATLDLRKAVEERKVKQVEIDGALDSGSSPEMIEMHRRVRKRRHKLSELEKRHEKLEGHVRSMETRLNVKVDMIMSHMGIASAFRFRQSGLTTAKNLTAAFQLSDRNMKTSR